MICGVEPPTDQEVVLDVAAMERGVKGKQRARLTHATNHAGLIIQLILLFNSSEAVANLALTRHCYAEPHHHRSALLPFAHSPLHYLSCPARYQTIH